MNKKITQFCNNIFQLKLKNGMITSFCAGVGQKGRLDTQYVLPNEAFGRVLVHGTVEGLPFSLYCDEEIEATSEIQYELLQSTCETVYQKAPITVTVRYTLVHEELRQEVTVSNTGSIPFYLKDLGFPFPCNSDFHWDVPAVDKVIGHHFVAGHGSHLLFQRCDGEGPILMAMPQDGTSFCHFDLTPMNSKAGAFDHPRTEAFTVYTHAALAQQKPLEAGAQLTHQSVGKWLQPGEQESVCMVYCFARDVGHARELFYQHGLVDVEIFPGLTVSRDQEVQLSLRCCHKDLALHLPAGATLVKNVRDGERTLVTLRFAQLGEQTIALRYAADQQTAVRLFVTQSPQTLLEKRAAFLKKCQHTDPQAWYYGLFGEWNNETGVLLGPDNYDRIGGWRIYEVSCDDPGLGKPAFLSGKLAELPVREEVKALDRYVEHFVWGGLQCTEEEHHPYGIYGIPDWKQNRESDDVGLKGKLHLWRIYDYPHIALMYYNLYRIARLYADMPLTQTAQTYLLRAYHTAVTMFVLPSELEQWTAYETGLYNELVIKDILQALRTEGLSFEADRLERHWMHKVHFFVCKCEDVFGSEYPFDTTGFESTHAFARYALQIAETEERDNRFDPPLLMEQAQRFMTRQMNCNISCRGVLEPTYFWYGSDYRANNTHYTLSYMSQMGGWAILDYALYVATDPFPLLRLGYGSVLSSWALMNAGEQADGYGYWFPGEEHDGAACGGYEPLALGQTWLDQPHHGGPWYYSCEIDLGYCGYLRAASTIVAEDPIFGRVCYGGTMQQQELMEIVPQDGVNRRFHYVGVDKRLHLLLDAGRMERLVYDKCLGTLTVTILTKELRGTQVLLQVESTGIIGGVIGLADGKLAVPVSGEKTEVVLRFQQL